MRFTTLAFAISVAFITSAQTGVMDPSFNPWDLGFGKGDGGLSTVERILEEPNGDLIVWRGLRHLDGKERTEIARIHPDGSLDPDFDPAISLAHTNRTIKSIARQSDGKLVILGDYSTFDGQASSGITRLFPDGTVDPSFNVSLSVPWEVMVLPDDKLLILDAGLLTRWMPDGAEDPTFTPAGPANIENVTVLPDGRILYAYPTGPYTRALSMRLPDGSVDASFDQSGMFDRNLHDIVVLADGRFLICGPFTHWNDTPVRGLVRLNIDGSLDMSFEASNATEEISVARIVLVEANGDLLVACQTTSANGEFTGLRRLAPDGTIDPDFHVAFDQLPDQLLRQSNGGTIAVGYFQHVQGHYRRSIVRMLPNGDVDMDFLPSTGAQGEINHVMPLADGRILIGGPLQGYDGLSVPNILRLNEDGSHDGTFDPGTGPMAANSSLLAVHTISTQPDGKYLVGGYFQAFNGQAASGMVRLHSDGTLDDTFRADQLTGTVTGSLVLPDGMVLASGRFGTTSNAPVSRYSLVRLLADGTVDPDFNASIQESVFGNIHRVLLLPDGDLLVAGFYNFMGGAACRNLGRLNADGSLDVDYGAAIAFEQWEEVTAIAVQNDGKLLLATSHGRLFRLFPDGGWDNTFDAGTGFDMPYDPVLIKDITPLPDGRLIVAGRFSSYDGSACGHIVCLNADGSVNTDFATGTGFFNYLGAWPLDIPANGVNDLAFDHLGRLLAVGAFTEYNGNGRNRIARFSAELPTTVPSLMRDGHIHPNPSRGVFQVGVEGAFTLVITDASGRMVLQRHGPQIPGRVDLSNEAPGVYFARISTDAGVFSERLVIAR
ncbi:MAG: T9SS type A sorting domain-containing protein [Flavobacteriales bacterium]|nr:T9SS type A sorting domain-containing protein [Flavobacteriales bacterium]